jgi:hypothetical protein
VIFDQPILQSHGLQNTIHHTETTRQPKRDEKSE